MALWLPTDLTSVTLQGWYRLKDATGVLANGATTTQAGGAVSQWNDSSGNGRHLPQSDGGTQPVYDANGLSTGNPSLEFNGFPRHFRIASGLALTGRVGVFALLRNEGQLTGTPRIISLNESGQPDYTDAGSIPIVMHDENYKLYKNGYSTASVSVATDEVALVQSYPASSSTYAVGKNGVIHATTHSNSTINTFDGLGVGSQGFSPGSYWVGGLGELVLFTGVISTSDREKLEGYLLHNAGLAANLDAAHPYKSAAPTTSSAVTLWTPADLAESGVSFVLGLRAMDTNGANAGAEITQAAGAVSQWSDWSGANNHFVQATGSAQPAYSATTSALGNKPGLTWDGSNDYFKNDALSFTGAAIHFFFVGRVDSYSGVIFEIGTGAFANQQRLAKSSSIWRAQGSSNNYTSWNHDDFSNPHVYSATIGPTKREVFSDGVSRSSNVTGTDSTPTATKMWIGAAQWNGEFTGLKIGEIVVIRGSLSQAGREQIEGYLHHKWGLAANLDAGHPYKSAAPTTGGGAPTTRVATASQSIAIGQSAVVTRGRAATASQSIVIAQSAVVTHRRAATASQSIVIAQSAVVAATVTATANHPLTFTQNAVADTQLLSSRVVSANQLISLSQSAVVKTRGVGRATHTITLTQAAVSKAKVKILAANTFAIAQSAVADVGAVVAPNKRITGAQLITIAQSGLGRVKNKARATQAPIIAYTLRSSVKLSTLSQQNLLIMQTAYVGQQPANEHSITSPIDLTGSITGPLTLQGSCTGIISLAGSFQDEIIFQGNTE